MTPIIFHQANTQFKPPPDLHESQCMTIHAYRGQVISGSVDGAMIVVVAWKPNTFELAELVAGKPIFLSCIGGLPPHFLTTDFEAAIRPS